MKDIKKSLLACGVSLVICFSALIGTTYSWFTDSVSNSGNTIKSGILKIALNDGATEALFSSDGFAWEPGRSQKAGVKVTNAGTLTLKYTLAVTDFLTENAAGVTSDISETLDVYKLVSETADLAGETPIGTLYDLRTGAKDFGTDKLLLPGENDVFYLVVRMRESAGNEYQGAGASFSIKVSAAQSNQTVVADASSLTEAVAAGTPVVLSENIALTETLPLPVGGDAQINLNGHTLAVSAAESTILSDKTSLTVENGNLQYTYGDGSDTVSSAFAVDTGSSVTLKNVDFQTNACGLYPRGDAATVNVIDSSVTAPIYCVSTNAEQVDNYNVVVNLKNSTLYTKPSDGWSSIPVLFNVPGILLMENCTVYGDRNAVAVRGGTATIKDCTLVKADTTSFKDWSGNWGAGTSMPYAALLIGNRSSAYQYASDVTLINTKIVAPDGNKSVYMYGNAGAGIGATLTYDADCQVGEIVKGNEYVIVNAPVSGD